MHTWVSRLQSKDIDLAHRGQFLTPDSQIRTSCYKKKLHFISDLLCIIYLLFIFALSNVYNPFESCSNVVGISLELRQRSEIFWNLRKWLGRFRKSRSWRHRNTRIWLRKSWRVWGHDIVSYKGTAFKHLQSSTFSILLNIKYLINLEINATIRNLIR